MVSKKKNASTYQPTPATQGPLIKGHCQHELWGLAVNPTKPQYCTVGDDKTVRVWDAETRKLVKFKELDSMARSCAYSPDGLSIAVGLGGRVGSAAGKKDGAFVILVLVCRAQPRLFSMLPKTDNIQREVVVQQSA